MKQILIAGYFDWYSTEQWSHIGHDQKDAEDLRCECPIAVIDDEQTAETLKKILTTKNSGSRIQFEIRPISHWKADELAVVYYNIKELPKKHWPDPFDKEPHILQKETNGIIEAIKAVSVDTGKEVINWKLDDIDSKIIEIYQAAAKENIKPPSYDTIAKKLYNANLTTDLLTRSAISKRVMKLRAAGLIEEPESKKTVLSPEHICDKADTHKMKF